MPLDVGKSASKQIVPAIAQARTVVIFGRDAIHSAFFNFGEVNSGQEVWKQEFLSTRFVFHRLCSAHDLKSHQGLHRRSLTHGKPADLNDSAMLKFVDHVAEELILRLAGPLIEHDKHSFTVERTSTKLKGITKLYLIFNATVL